MYSSNRKKEKNNESIFSHFILIGVLLVESFLKLIYLLNPTTKRNNSKQSHIDYQKLEMERNVLINKSNQELKELISGIDITSTFSKEQLVNLILGNPDAMQQFILIERKLTLEKMTNQELRSLIIGGGNISRLKKSELINLILDNYQKRTEDHKEEQAESVNINKIKNLDLLEKSLNE